MIIVKAELSGRIVAQLDQFDEIVDNRISDLLACFPGQFPFVAIFFRR
ncbi:hypothetical protein ES703_59337 [subsurface metagenome]